MAIGAWQLRRRRGDGRVDVAWQGRRCRLSGLGGGRGRRDVRRPRAWGVLGLRTWGAGCTAPGFLDTRLRYAAWRSSYCSRASSGRAIRQLLEAPALVVAFDELGRRPRAPRRGFERPGRRWLCSLSVRFQRSTTPLVSGSSTKPKLGWMPQIAELIEKVVPTDTGCRDPSVAPARGPRPPRPSRSGRPSPCAIGSRAAKRFPTLHTCQPTHLGVPVVHRREGPDPAVLRREHPHAVGTPT